MSSQMLVRNTTSVLASFATLKILNDSKKYATTCQILSEYINYIICTQKICSFTSVEMKNKLREVFSFHIPEAVVKTALKPLKFVSKSNGLYYVDRNKIEYNESFEETKDHIENINKSIISSLKTFIVTNYPDTNIDDDKLTQDFIAFLVDDHAKELGAYTDLISKFILVNENNQELQKNLSLIREGSILYVGLNYNINETGSITKPLTLYLATEILFSLYGFNGEIYKQIANDLWAQIKSANSKGPKIHLKYLTETKEEIDTFFDTAEMIAEGRFLAHDKPAMSAITNGCASASDVKIKRADFFHALQYTYDVKEENTNDFYSEKYNPYNLESMDHLETQDQESWKFISHINKLRKGEITSNILDAGHIFVTATKSILKASYDQRKKLKEENELEYVSDYAVPIERLTSILWYKLGNGFGNKEYPKTVNCVLKARTVLASLISHKVETIFSETKEQHKNGKIDDDKLAARIIMLRKKPTFPEELTGDSIDEMMDFSPEYLSRYEEEAKSNKKALEEKEIELEKIKEHNKQEIQERDDALAKKDEEILRRSEETAKISDELQRYKQKERERAAKIQKAKNIALFSWNIFWKLAIIVIVVLIAIYLENKLQSKIPSLVCAVIDLAVSAGSIYTIIKKDLKKYVETKNTISDDSLSTNNTK